MFFIAFLNISCWIKYHHYRFFYYVLLLAIFLGKFNVTSLLWVVFCCNFCLCKNDGMFCLLPVIFTTCQQLVACCVLCWPVTPCHKIQLYLSTQIWGHHTTGHILWFGHTLKISWTQLFSPYGLKTFGHVQAISRMCRNKEFINDM